MTPTQTTEDPIRTLLQSHVETARDSVGFVAAIADETGSRFITAGGADPATPRPLDADTVFEIGSVTKVFTALLLAEMVGRGELAWSDPVSRYLPPEGRTRRFDGREITLLDLATYTSGLPRLPDNFAPADAAHPYADYTVPQLYAFLAAYRPRYYPGSHYIYANLGFGLLGHVLGLRAGRSFEDLLIDRVCRPLGLPDTRIALIPSMQSRLTPGHDAGLRTVANWEFPSMPGAGALRSTARDLLRFVQICQGVITTPLANAIASLLHVRRQTGTADEVAAAGWFVWTANDDQLVWKDGGTGGYAAFAGYSSRTRRAAVLLANTAAYGPTSSIGRHLVVPGSPLPTVRRQVTVDPSALTPYAGQYRLSPETIITVTPKEGRLMVQLTNQDEYEVLPSSATEFFYRAVDAQLTFETATNGPAPAVVLHQSGRDMRAVRIA